MKRFLRLSAYCAALTLSVLIQINPVLAVGTAPELHTVYAGPGEKTAAVSEIADGDTVTVLNRKSGPWAHVLLSDGTIGYCASSLLSASATVQDSSRTAGNTSRIVYLREAPDDESPAILRLGANVTVLLESDAEANGYLSVEAGGSKGFLSADALTLFTQTSATVRTAPELSATGVTDEKAASAVLTELSLYFEDGRYWNHEGDVTVTPFSVTDTPCDHSGYGYGPCNVYNGATADYFPEYGDEMQCLGFASLLSDLVFGTDAPVSSYYDFDSIRVGDHIRFLYYEHSMLVTAVGTEADGTRFVRVAEANENYEDCKIEWGRILTEQDILNYGDGVMYLTRYQ